MGTSLVYGQNSPSQWSYPKAASKKGLQVELLKDAIALNIKHAAFNVNLSQLIDPVSVEESKRKPNSPRWTREGKAFFFQQSPLEQLDQKIKTLSDRGVIVHLIILSYESSDEWVNRIMLHPGYDRSAPHGLAAFNSATAEGREWFSATMEFLANRWSRDDQKFGRVAGYIIGNEVNSHWWWSNMGRVSMQEFADAYWVSLRAAHKAVRSQSTAARVYVSLEHHWNIRNPPADEKQAFPAREFVDYLAQKSRESAEADFDWHIAFHPYPENLFEPRFWNDKTALPSPDTPRITFKNLEVLTEYLKSPELLYQGNPRRVILSEQGFHTPAGSAGEQIQAAAFCYAYRIAEHNEGIDAFILHRHVDHPNEGGLRLGLRRRQPNEPESRPVKKIYSCFRDADTDHWKSAFEFALPLVGLEDWDEPRLRK